ncbi:MAG TPA: transposase [Gammaproteobacteria bacterium]
MARPLRLEFAGALYHITSRGDGREDIYLSDGDRTMFLEVLSEVCERFNWECHAYCLMSNHYHLLIETPDANLSQGMRQLNGVYTQRFNRVHGRVGHVFQGRYKGILVEKDSYLLELARYIVLNPVRAGMVRSAKDWPWSSYRATGGQIKPPDWLTVDWILSAFAARKSKAIEGYKQFVAEGKNQPAPWAFLKNQIYLGSDKFVERMQKQIEADKDLSEVPSSQRRSVAKLLPVYEQKAADRDTAIVMAYNSGGYSMKEIGDYFGLHYSRVSKIITKAKGKT